MVKWGVPPYSASEDMLPGICFFKSNKKFVTSAALVRVCSLPTILVKLYRYRYSKNANIDALMKLCYRYSTITDHETRCQLYASGF